MPFQCGEQGDDNARARGPDGMSERAGAAMYVHLLMRQFKIAHRRHDDDGEGLVNLEQVDFVEPPADPVRQLSYGADGGGPPSPEAAFPAYLQTTVA
jgi:hypothetical protein